MSVPAAVLLSTVLGLLEPPATPTPAPAGPPLVETTESVRAREEKPPRPDDKTLVASLDVEQGDGKDRLSLYRDGTLALVKTYLGVRTLKKKVVSEEEVAFIARVCSEPLALDVGTYRSDVLGTGEPRRFRIEVGLPGSLPRVFDFDELSRVPLVLGRARGALEGLLARFDETTVSQDDLWDPSGVREGDVLTNRNDGKRYRVVRDDTFVRSLEVVEEERSLQRLVVLREDVPRLFLDPKPAAGSGPPR